MYIIFQKPCIPLFFAYFCNEYYNLDVKLKLLNMKKTLLFFAAFALVFSTFAQRNLQAVKKDNTFATKAYLKADQNESLGPVNQSKTLITTAFHSSLNGYTLSAGKKVTADQTSKKALYTARAGGSFGFSGDDISFKMTTDGAAFDSVTFVSSYKKRYQVVHFSEMVQIYM